MREKCDVCGDRIFKIIDGKVMCRQKHIKVTYVPIQKSELKNSSLIL